METDSLPVALHVSALQVARAEGDLAGVAGEGVGRTRCHASHVEECRLERYTALCAREKWQKNKRASSAIRNVWRGKLSHVMS